MKTSYRRLHVKTCENKLPTVTPHNHKLPTVNMHVCDMQKGDDGEGGKGGEGALLPGGREGGEPRKGGGHPTRAGT